MSDLHKYLRMDLGINSHIRYFLGVFFAAALYSPVDVAVSSVFVEYSVYGRIRTSETDWILTAVV